MLVSVITPTYNRADVLPRAISSVSKQSYDPIEHVIVDDGSSDNTEDVIENFSHKGNLKYIELDENRGVSEARNRGINAANGDLICFLDSDDELRKTAISRLVDAISEEPDQCAGVFGHQAQYFDSKVQIESYDTKNYYYSDLTKMNFIGGFGGKLFRSCIFDRIGKIDKTLPRAEDYDYFLRTLEKGYYMRCIDSVIFNRYYNNNQITNDHRSTIEGQKRILEKHGDALSKRNRAHRTYTLGHAYARTGQITKANRAFRTCLTIYPSCIAYYYYYLSTLFGEPGYKAFTLIKRLLYKIMS